jgi:single-stranded DNA-binding protein
MIDALINGKLIRDCELKTSANGNAYCNFLLSVHTGEPAPMVITGIAFSDVAEKIARLKKGDALTVVGSLKPSEWTDKTTGETKHGLSVTVSNGLTAYDIKKRKGNQ